MTSPDFEELVLDFALLENWEDRYRYIIEAGKQMHPLDQALKVPATKVDGCASQVWLHLTIVNGELNFYGDSDAMIVKGLIFVLKSLFNGLKPKDILEIDARYELSRLELDEHLSLQRSNGLNSMINRLQKFASDQA